MGDLFMLKVIVVICYATFNASAWSVNNFLITGPKAYLTYTTSVALGAQSGIEECKFQFAWERWNCPENALQLSTHNRLRSATRETSFIHAISSAGVMYTITKNCSMGDFENCGCDESKKWKTGGHGWIWGGCSDNVEFGERISKLFVDSPGERKGCQSPDESSQQQGRQAGGYRIWPVSHQGQYWQYPHICAALYNLPRAVSYPCFIFTPPSRSGMAAPILCMTGLIKPESSDLTKWLGQGNTTMRATMRRTCKCHGISGSCSIQTCWLQLADFREMGDYLKVKYEQALKIEMDKRRLRAGNSAEGHWAPMEAFLPSAESELIFLEESPDYCTRNSSLGIYGTEGRECLQNSHNTSRQEQHNCGRLCTDCGLQIEERRTEAISSCNCKFQWCCTVKCDQCRHVVNKYYCMRSPRSAWSLIRAAPNGTSYKFTCSLCDYDNRGDTISLLKTED